MDPTILVLNAGSSSLKFGLFEYPEGGSALGQIALGVARSGTESNSQIKIAGRDGSLLVDGSWPGSTVDDLVTCLMSWIDEGSNFGPVILTAYYNRYAGCPYRPSRLARFVKLARAWWADNGLMCALWVSLVVVYVFWWGWL